MDRAEIEIRRPGFHAPAVSEDETTFQSSLSELQPGSPAAQAEPDLVLLPWCCVQAHAALCSSTVSCVPEGHQEVEILPLGEGHGCQAVIDSWHLHAEETPPL